jgi:hypothetical protein
MGKTYAKGRKPHEYKKGTSRLRWTDEAIFAAIRLWVERYGEVPYSEEWNWKTGKGKDPRHATGEFPSGNVVRKWFGSWEAGIRAAGFEPRVAPSLQRKQLPDRYCEACGRLLVRRDNERYWNFARRTTCGRACAARAHGNPQHAQWVERRDRIVAMVRDGRSLNQVAQAEGVSQHAVASVLCRARRDGIAIERMPHSCTVCGSFEHRATACPENPDRRPPRTHCRHGHELTPENQYHYKGGVQCRACRRAAEARREARARA